MKAKELKNEERRAKGAQRDAVIASRGTAPKRVSASATAARVGVSPPLPPPPHLHHDVSRPRCWSGARAFISFPDDVMFF